MPGIVGQVGDPDRDTNLSTAIESLCHFTHYHTASAAPLPGVQFGQIWRAEKESENAWHRDAESGCTAFVNGSIVAPGTRPTPLRASDIVDAYLRDSLDPASLDGSFLVAICDPRHDTVTVFNDRLGTLPCYYHFSPSHFCFAPEAKAIFAITGEVPAYSESGIVSFLTLGYCLGKTTLFDNILALEPGSRLTISRKNRRHSVERYWSIQYDPAAEFHSRRRAEEALYEAILCGHRSTFSPSNEKYDLLLSGGWDSRGLLASADALGHLPRRSVSWGLRDDIPMSDPYLARELARQYGIDHHFISYDTDSFAQNAENWSCITELNTDNFGWYGEGTSILLNEYANQVDFVVAGDENWGFGGHVDNLVEGMATCHMPAPAAPVVAAGLSDRLARGYTDIYTGEVNSVLIDCENQHPVDRRDYLYVHGRVARFIFSLGYYKELAVEVRRPFLNTAVLDTIARVPIKFRYNKNLYISTLIRYFPELLRVNKRAANSLPAWRRDLCADGKTGKLFRSLLTESSLSASPVSSFLNVPNIVHIADEFLSESHQEEGNSKDRSARYGYVVQSIKQRVAEYEKLQRSLGMKKAPSRSLKQYDFLRRIALLVLLDRNIASFSNPARVRRSLPD